MNSVGFAVVLLVVMTPLAIFSLAIQHVPTAAIVFLASGAMMIILSLTWRAYRRSSPQAIRFIRAN